MELCGTRCCTECMYNVHGSMYLPREYLHVAGIAMWEHVTRYVTCGIGTQQGLLCGVTWLTSTTRLWLFPPPHLWWGWWWWGQCKVHNSHCCICSSSISLCYSIYNRSLVGFCGCFTSYIVLANYYVKHLYFCYLLTPVITGIDHIPTLLLIIWVLYSPTCQQPGESQGLL